MSDGALDLSLSSYEVNTQRTSRSHDQVSSDSGRASSDSTLSDIHEDIKPRFKTSPPPTRMSLSHPSGTIAPLNNEILPPSDYPPGNTNTAHHLGHRSSLKSPVTYSPPPPPPSSRLHNPTSNFPTVHHTQQQQQQQQLSQTTTNMSSSTSPPPQTKIGLPSRRLSNSNSPEVSPPSLPEDGFKPLPVSSMSSNFHPDRTSDPRVAPIRPFKMYPVDAFNVYNSQLMPAVSGGGGGLSPSPVGLQSLYDSGSPSSFPSFPLTPLTSHLLQRKRRAELRETANTTTTKPMPGKFEEGGSMVSAVENSSTSSLGMMSLSTSSPGAMRRDSDDDDGDEENQGNPDKKGKFMPDENKDDAYWDRRRKNNEAAKRSRDARRQKEEEIAMRAAFLEQENLKLRAQVAILKNETAKLHYMLYNRI